MLWSPPAYNMRLAVSSSEGRNTIRVAGELDVTSVSVLADELARLAETPGRVVLDLSQVTFCVVAGVNLLIDLYHQDASMEGGPVVDRAHSAVLRMLQLCGGPVGLRIAQDCAASLPPDAYRRRRAVVTEALAVALDITDAPMGNAQLLDPATGALRIVAQRGFDRPFLTFFETVHDSDAACGTAAQERLPVFVDEVTTSPIFAGTPALDVLADANVGAVTSVPITFPDSTLIGVVSAHHHQPTAWPDGHRRMLDSLSRAPPPI